MKDDVYKRVDGMVDENFITRFFHNARFKSIFSKCYIKSWVGNYKWEKTPTTPENLGVARNALLGLVPIYNVLGNMDRKRFDAAQGGFFNAFFKGFFTNLFERIKGNPGKVDEIIKFNQAMKQQVKNMSDRLEAYLNELDKMSAGEDVKEGVTSFDEYVVVDEEEGEEDNSNTNPKNDETEDANNGNEKDDENGNEEDSNNGNEEDSQEEEDVKEAAKNFKIQLNSFCDILKKSSKKDDETISLFLNLYAKNVGPKGFDEKCVNLSKEDSNIIQDLNNAVDAIKVAQKDEQSAIALVMGMKDSLNNDVEIPEFINLFINSTSADNDETTGEGDLASVLAAYAEGNDQQTQELMWEKGSAFSLSNIYAAENSLYKIMVFLGAFIDNFNAGKVFGKGGVLMDVDASQMMEFLKTPAGKALTALGNAVTTANQTFQKSGAFGSLQESVVKEFEEAFRLLGNTKDFKASPNMKKKIQLAEALDRMRAEAFGCDPKSKECNNPSEEILTPSPLVPENNSVEELTLEDDCCEEDVLPTDALARLKENALDGEIPPEEVLRDKEKKEQEDIVLEAPPANPTDPNADPNAAAPADPNAAPEAAVPMDISDLGTPPVDPTDPTAGGTVDPDAAGGADPTAPADPNAAAPAGGDVGGGDMGGNAGSPTPSPADSTPPSGGEASPSAVNVAGEEPNAAGTENGEVDKYDIGVTKPLNNVSDELSLTDDEQEQLFTKINLLAKVPDLVNFGKYLYNLTPENVDLGDIHYINTLYELCVKLNLLTDEFKNNNLLKKYDSYQYTVLSKNPEQALDDASQEQDPQAQGQVAESSHKIKTKTMGEVEVIDAPGMIDHSELDEYKEKMEDAREDAIREPDEAYEDYLADQNIVKGVGSLVTFSGLFSGRPVVTTYFVKKRRGETRSPKKIAEDELTKMGYRNINIINIEDVDPVETLKHEYSGMKSLQDAYFDTFTRSLMKEGTTNSVGEEVEVGAEIPGEMKDDISACIDMLNDEIMEDPEIDYTSEQGVKKLFVSLEDFEEVADKPQVNEDGSVDSTKCSFTIKESCNNNLKRILFSINCQKICKCLEGIASTYGYTFEAVAEGDDKIILTFSK